MTKFSDSWKSLAFAASFAAALALTACDEAAEVSEEQYIERAQQYRQAGDLRASSIELKNALQKNPDSARARLLLGQLYVEIGDGDSAEKELNRARDLGMDESAVNRSLGLAWILQRKYQTILDNIKVDSANSALGRAAALSLRGSANLGLGNTDAAQSDYEAALREDPKSVESMVGLARLHLALGKREEADGFLARAKAEAPTAINVLVLDGDIAYIKKDYAASEASYQKIVQDHPNRRSALIGVARAQIGGGKHDEAIENLDHLLKQAPNFAPANYLRALALFRKGDYDTAKIHVERVLNISANDLRSLFISGASGYAVGELEHAKKRLTQFLSQVPTNDHARRLLGATLLRLAQADEALDQLRPLIEGSKEDAELLAMIADAAVQSGDLESGSKYFSQALEADPTNSALQARLGATRIALGDQETGLSDLEQAIKNAPDALNLRLQYAANLLRAKKLEEARKAAQDIQNEWPNEPHGYTIEGIALMNLGDKATAVQKFERVLELRPGAPDASNNLATIAENNGDLNKARDYVQASAEHFPDDTRILLRLATLESQLGNPDKSIEILEKAMQINERDGQVRNALARAYMITQRPDKALDLAQEGLKLYPNQPPFLEISGRALMALDRADEAVLVFRDLVKLLPDSAEAWHRLAVGYESVGNADELETALDKAIQLDPDYVPAIIAKGRLHAARHETAEAKRILAKLENDHADQTFYLELAGMVALLENRSVDAVAAFDRAYKAQPTGPLAVQLASAHVQAGDDAAAAHTLRDWLEYVPRDSTVRFQLARLLEGMGDASAARTEYETIVTQWPNHWLALNNLAILLSRAGDKTGAMSQIEKAVAIAPDHPGIADTLGTLLLESGDTDRAVRVLQRAADSAPNLVEIQFHFAQALAAAGQYAQARTVLDKVLSSEAPLPFRDEAEKLLSDIDAR